MGIFDKVVNSGFYEAPEIKGYNTACFEQVNAEAVMDELALFEAQVSGDFAEHQAILTEDADILTEGVMGDIWNKAKNFFKKIWAKIKQIFNNIMMRLNAQFMKKNKVFAKKYEKDIRKKLLQNLEDLKIETYEKLMPGKKANNFDALMTGTIKEQATTTFDKTQDYKKANEDFDADDKYEAYIKDMTKLDVSKGELRKEMEDEILGDKETFDEEKEVKDLGYAALSFLLGDSDKTMTKLKHVRDSIDKCFTKVMDDVDKAEKACNDLSGTSTSFTNMKKQFKASYTDTDKKAKHTSADIEDIDKGDMAKKIQSGNPGAGKAHADAVTALANYRAWLSLVTKEITEMKTAFTDLTSARYNIYQMICKEYRHVCVKVYTFRPKKEDSFNEDMADAMMNYINFTEDYEEDIIL